MENTSENDKTAAEWQGTDRYPGIDAYEKKTLPCGTKLYALVYRGVDNKFDTPAYFFDEKALEGIGDDSTQLNERLQIRPYSGDGLTASYRAEVVVYELKKDLEFEYGQTRENGAYGKGNFTQFYMPDKVVMANVENGAMKQEAGPGIFLSNSTLTEEQYGDLKLRQNQILLRRNLFCHLKAKLDTMDVIQNSPNLGDVEQAKENLKKLNGDICEIKRTLKDSIKRIGSISSPRYDRLNKQLSEEIGFRESHPNALFLTNKDLKIEADRIAKDIDGKSAYKIVTVNGKDEVAEISKNLSEKMDKYNPAKGDKNEINVGKAGLELTDVLDANRFNREAKQRMDTGELRQMDYSKMDTIALQKQDGTIEKYELSKLFDGESVKKLQQIKNGGRSDTLLMKDGRTEAVLDVRGNSAVLLLRKDKDISIDNGHKCKDYTNTDREDMASHSKSIGV